MNKIHLTPLVLACWLLLATVAFAAEEPKQSAPQPAGEKTTATQSAALSEAPAVPKPPPPPLPPPPQVRIEARVLEWQLNNSLDFDFAVQYQADPGSGNVLGDADLTLPANPSLSSAARIFLSNMDAGNGSFDAVVEMLKGVGNVRVLSEPSIILTSLQVDPTQAAMPPSYNPKTASETPWSAGSARLTNATQVPYALSQYVGYNLAEVTQYRDTGVTMDVQVQCVKDSLIFLDTRVIVSDVTSFISVARDQQNCPQTVPVIDSRMIQNRLVIPDRTIFISGLMKTTREVEQRRGIPWLSELPGLRWLLSSLKKQNVDSELVFLIKPEIMSPSRTATGLMAQGR